MKLDKSHTKHLEHDIRPPMKSAITIPVDNIGATGRGVIIYVCSSPFTGADVSDAELRRVAEALELKQ